MTTLKIRFGGYQNPNSIHNQAAVFFGQILQEKLGNDLDFELIGNVLNLGRNSGDLPNMVESGELTCCYISTVRFTEWVPEISILDLPFLIKDRAQVQRAFRGQLGAYFKEQFEHKTTFKLMGIWDNGFRHITNKVRPIRTPDDCSGLSIRTQMSDIHVESLGMMGFKPIPVDVKVFVDEIAGPRFDAQDNPLTNTFNFGVHHYHRYFTLSGHFFGGTAFICNAKVFQSWPEKIQEIVMNAALESTEYQWKLASQEDEHILKQIDLKENDIVYLTDEERELFRKAVQPVLKKYQEIIPAEIFQMLQD
ncbi:MAG: TRAP transporter substrate-binding protein [Betaproteobacteria bacterium]|jgi:TRAP-type C4-dicarboxylate transport system substrate-binding protein